MSFYTWPRLVLSSLLATPLAALLTGCTLQTTAPLLPVAATTGIGGTVMGGNIPISGSTIYLIAIGESGYGSPNSTNILATTTTGTDGSFTLPTFSCGGRFTHTFIEARGGNPGLAPGTSNSAIFLAAIPTLLCSDINTNTHIHIDEVTTVAAAYTLRPFVTGNNVGTSSTNIIGLSNAYSTYVNLVNTATGTSPGASVPTGMSVPFSTINALANSLTACVNTTGPSSTACSTLFTDSGVSSTGTTANTFNIAVAIATNPQANATDIFNTAGTTPPFQPALTNAPNDWSLAVTYTSGNLTSAETALDIDTSGNVWVATQGGLAGTMEEIDPTGTLLNTNVLNGTLDSPTALAFDQSGNIVIANNASGDTKVLEYSPSSSSVVFRATANFSNPTSVAVDANNEIAVSDANGTLYGISDSSGSTIHTVYHVGIASPVSVANNGDISLVNSYEGLDLYTPNAFNGGLEGNCGCHGSVQDSDAASSIYMVNQADIYYIPSPYTAEAVGVTINNISPGRISAMTFDGLGKLWAGTSSTAAFSLINLIPGGASGYNLNYSNLTDLLPATTTLSVAAMAIDGSGNVWLANSSTGGLVEVVGAAAPLATPRAIAVKNATLATRP